MWGDFSTGQCGDALDLVRAVLNLDIPETLAWSRRWLGIEDGAAELPARPAPALAPMPEPASESLANQA